MCLLVTVLGTTAPVCSLAIISGDGSSDSIRHRMNMFIGLLAASGCVSATFTVAFAYISDVVTGEKARERRVAAYGMALATLGLSYSVGPMAGGYIGRTYEAVLREDADVGLFAGAADVDVATADVNSEVDLDIEFEPEKIISAEGQNRVFALCLILTVVNLLYMIYVLPESRKIDQKKRRDKLIALCPFLELILTARQGISGSYNEELDNAAVEDFQNPSLSSECKESNFVAAPLSFRPTDSIRVFAGDPLLAEVGRITFLYYTSLWAVASTMLLYAAKRFEMSPGRLGELMSAFGLCTMLSEGVLVRITVASFGEHATLRFGLLAFVIQCTIIGLAWEGWMLFLCVIFSLASNLVYPSLTSLVSEAVNPEAVGEALGALNGIRALTEGFSPLLFGFLMTMSETSKFQGWPYFVAALFAAMAYRRSTLLPGIGKDYISEKHIGAPASIKKNGRMQIVLGLFRTSEEDRSVILPDDKDPEEEYVGLLDDFVDSFDGTTDKADPREIQESKDDDSTDLYSASYFQGEGI